VILIALLLYNHVTVSEGKESRFLKILNVSFNTLSRVTLQPLPGSQVGLNEKLTV